MYKKFSSNVSQIYVTLKFLRNLLTDEDQILYTYSLKTSKINELQRHSLKLPEKHKLNRISKILAILYKKVLRFHGN